MTHYVYYLLDPESLDLLYVGRSNDPANRQRDFHRKKGRQTVMGLCQRHSSFELACAAELRAIRQHRPPFNRIEVSNKGGLGHTVTQEHRDKIRGAQAKRVRSADERARIRASLTGRPTPPEVIAKRIATRKRNSEARGISIK